MFIPQSTSGGLVRRASCGNNQSLGNDGNCYGTNSFYFWGRWVLAALVIIFFIALFVSWSCITNRRRRRQGMHPRYGTGWMMGGPYGGYGAQGQPPPPQQQPAPQYGHGGWFGANKTNENPPPPQYTPNAVPNQYTGTTFNSNEGYYGHHQNDVPLQQPAGSYYPRGGEPVYEPPSGPPPPKN